MTRQIESRPVTTSSRNRRRVALAAAPALIAAALIGATATLIEEAAAQRPRGGPPGPASVFAASVEDADFANRIEALGSLAPNERVDLTLNAADRVTALYFDDGERVKAGDTLLSLAQREQAALTEAAQTTLDEARLQLERAERLAKQNAVSRAELDQARRDADNAAAQLRAVQSRQNDRVLVAPFDGVLGFRQVSIGSFVRPGDIVATLIDDSVMRLEFAVPSTFLTAVGPGAPIVATTDDLPGQAFSGKIASVDNAIDVVTRSVRVRATLPNPDRLLKAGMFMSVTVNADARRRPAVPEEAVQPIGPRNYVYVIEADGENLLAHRREVELGARERGLVEVVSGVATGERVVTEGLIRVRDGAPVIVRDETILQPVAGGAAKAAAAAAGASGL